MNFTKSEYTQRLTKTHAEMARRNLDVLLVTDPSNMAWLTGYDGWSFYTHQCVILALGDDPIWFGRGIDAKGAKRTTYLPDERIIGYLDDYVQSTSCHPMDYLAEMLAARNWARSAIGVEMDNYYFSAAAYHALTTHLPNVRFKDATALVNWQRAVKSEQELTYMRQAARIVEAMHAAIFAMIEPGLPKNHLAAEIMRVGTIGVDGVGGDYPAIMPMLPSGADATAPHLTWDDQPLRAGEGTFFEISGCVKRYHCPLSRTIFLGAPEAKYRAAEEAVLEGTQAAFAVARPGNTCEAVAAAFFTVIKRHGFSKDNRTGYPIGLSYPPDWGERTMSLRHGDKTVLTENMTFHFMPALWLDDGGLEITESIVIGPDGAEPLATVPRKILVKD